MKVTANFKLGSNAYQIEAESENAKEALYEAIVLSSPPTKCDHCGNTEGGYLTANKDRDTNIYINIKCSKCGARAGLGSLKAGGYFWKKYEPYVPKNAPRPAQNISAKQAPDDIPVPDDMPF